MKFGLALPHYDYSLPGITPIEWSFLRDWAQRAEGLGFDSIWVSDHLFIDLSKYGAGSERYSSLECFTSLAALAVCTEQVRLGSLVAANDLRSPALVAKMAATVHAISGGRFELGLGAGWYEPEFQAAGIAFESAGGRIDRLAEAVQVIRAMLSSERASFTGKHYRIDAAWNLPRPAADSFLPVIIGGKGERMARIAGRYADGFNAGWAWTPEAYGKLVKVVKDAANKAGRNPSAIKKSVGLYALPGRDDSELVMRWERYLAACPAGIGNRLDLKTWRQDKLAGTPEQIAETIRAFEATGAEEVILGFGLLPFQICDASAVEDLITQVKPLLV